MILYFKNYLKTFFSFKYSVVLNILHRMTMLKHMPECVPFSWSTISLYVSMYVLCHHDLRQET